MQAAVAGPYKENKMASPFVLDRESILDRLGGDEEIYAMMVDMYIQDVDHNCSVLADAYTSGDPKALQREAHTIKGLLATFSDEGGVADALLLEQLAREGKVEGLQAAIDGLQERMREVASVLAAGKA
jgi:HPt (histidine-containing phosphotransfer) domain-containing protein